jgi:hypothetical protein
VLVVLDQQELHWCSPPLILRHPITLVVGTITPE